MYFKLILTFSDPYFVTPDYLERIKKWTYIPLFDAPTIVPQNKSTFCAPGSQNSLKLKNPVYIDELYNSLKNLLSVQRGSSCVNFGQKYSFNCKL